jgi:hypothetical protein
MFKHGGDADRAKYNDFFQSPAFDQYPEKLITAKKGPSQLGSQI